MNTTKVDLFTGEIMDSKPGPKPLRHFDPTVQNFKPRMPSGLHRYGQAYWRKVVGVLSEAGQLTPADTGGLEGLVYSYATMRVAAEQLATEGATHVDERGIIRKHPAFQVWRDAQASYRSWATQFGLTPLSRKSVPQSKTPGKSLVEQLHEMAGA